MSISKKNKLQIKGIDISYKSIDSQDFINITDIAKYKNPEVPRDIIKNWLRNKNTIQLLGLWEKLYNPNFKQVEFDGFSINISSEIKWERQGKLKLKTQ